MTQEERELLTKDLGARLYCGVKGKVETTDGNGNEIKDEGVLNSVFIDEYGKAYICIEGMEYELDDFKPYLRPMGSMTEEEKEELKDITHPAYDGYTIYDTPAYTGDRFVYSDDIEDLTDFYNSHHFDYRGLIDMGLALEAPEGMYQH